MEAGCGILRISGFFNIHYKENILNSNSPFHLIIPVTFSAPFCFPALFSKTSCCFAEGGFFLYIESDPSSGAGFMSPSCLVCSFREWLRADSVSCMWMFLGWCDETLRDVNLLYCAVQVQAEMGGVRGESIRRGKCNRGVPWLQRAAKDTSAF